MFLHLSFKDNLSGIWEPKLPDGSGGQTTMYSEPDIPRISVSTSVTLCFYAIYPNINKLFEVEKYPHMDFFIYSPVNINKNKMMTPKQLTDLRYVMDAHVTNEYWLLEKTEMQLVGKVRIYNPGNNATFVKFHPYNDNNLNALELAPKKLKMKTLTL